MELREKLLQEFDQVKQNYFGRVNEWALKQVQLNIKRRDNYYNKTKADFPGMDYYKEQKWVYNTPSWNFDFIKFTEKALKDAQSHYHQMIEKLIFRINDKGLDVDKITIQSVHLGVNIDTVITDGVKTVTTSTIVASGPVQRPHYRYLIK
jgi:hypothetical protein